MNAEILFTPYLLNKYLTLKNRIIMAPMTRNMADANYVPNKDAAMYYARRAEAGLIVTEGTIIRPDGQGYTNVPLIYTDAQINGWRKITDTVHENHGNIFSQIWHVGRVSHPEFLNGQLPLSPSETEMTGVLNRAQHLSYGKSRAVTKDEIKGLVESFAQAAKNAIRAGFDGVEIHGANGYLIDQFMHYHTNHRTDEYGGTPENMSRFTLEVVKACGDTIGYERVGLRLSPAAYLQQITPDTRDQFIFQHLLTQLNSLSIAYVHTGNFDDKKIFSELNNKSMTHFMREHYRGTLIACGGYTLAEAEKEIAANQFDLVAIGRPFLANPNFIQLSKQQQPVQTYSKEMLDRLY